MSRNFTSSQVLTGEVNYTVESFARDLKTEVKSILDELLVNNPTGRFDTERMWLRLSIEVCNFLSKGADLTCLFDFYKKNNLVFCDPNVLKRLLELIKQVNVENIQILNAVTVREWMIGRGLGLKDEDIFDIIRTYHKRIFDEIEEV